MEPVREIPPHEIMKIKNANRVKKIKLRDFEKSIRNNHPSISKASILETTIGISVSRVTYD